MILKLVHTVFLNESKKLLIGFCFYIYGLFDNALSIPEVSILLVQSSTTRRPVFISKVSHKGNYANGGNDIKFF